MFFQGGDEVITINSLCVIKFTKTTLKAQWVQVQKKIAESTCKMYWVQVPYRMISCMSYCCQTQQYTQYAVRQFGLQVRTRYYLVQPTTTTNVFQCSYDIQLLYYSNQRTSSSLQSSSSSSTKRKSTRTPISNTTIQAYELCLYEEGSWSHNLSASFCSKNICIYSTEWHFKLYTSNQPSN